ncbi:hypothetical protein [Anaerorhabdus sp.]|uniref:hypothetical protein n=1 Tax=Anaerorhabdus sp. TaxID=1872524 RepID=UPI002FC755A3
MTKKIVTVILFIVGSNPLLNVSAENIFSKVHNSNEHIYGYATVGNRFDRTNNEGETECMQTYIGICNTCGDYYYTDIHAFWYK